MLKKILSVISAAGIALSFAPLSAAADDTVYSVDYGLSTINYQVNGEKAYITGISAWGASADIPQTLNGYTVTAINDKAFLNQTGLESLVLPDTVEYIGNNAFAGCTSLKSISLPENLAEMGSGTFLSCTSLTEVEYNGKIKYVPDDCFASCSELKSVTLNAPVQDIGSEAFADCDELIMEIPSTVTNIGENALGMKYNSVTKTFSAVENYLIIGAAGTAAESYAKSIGAEFLDTISTIMGDLNFDLAIDAGDASDILQEYARLSTGGEARFDRRQQYAADWDRNRVIDAADASAVLSEYARLSTAS